jgi:hypothetical protein
MSDWPDNKWHWGRELLNCFDDLRDEFAVREPAVVDCEVIPGFSGDPNGMAIWLICRNAADVARLANGEPELWRSIARRMCYRGFPSSAVESVRIAFTSWEDIRNGGGRFFFFR